MFSSSVVSFSKSPDDVSISLFSSVSSSLSLSVFSFSIPFVLYSELFRSVLLSNRSAFSISLAASGISSSSSFFVFLKKSFAVDSVNS